MLITLFNIVVFWFSCLFSLILVIMNILSWNCKGAGNKRIDQALRCYAQQAYPGMVAFMETKCSGPKLLRSSKDLGSKTWVSK